MTLRLRVRQAASKDIVDAYAWYEAQQSGLGARFLEAVEHCFERLQFKPDLYPLVQGDARRILVRNFPYAIYFAVRGEEIRIIAVLHQHRDPRITARRVG